MVTLLFFLFLFLLLEIDTMKAVFHFLGKEPFQIFIEVKKKKKKFKKTILKKIE